MLAVASKTHLFGLALFTLIAFTMQHLNLAQVAFTLANLCRVQRLTPSTSADGALMLFSLSAHISDLLTQHCLCRFLAELQLQCSDANECIAI